LTTPPVVDFGDSTVLQPQPEPITPPADPSLGSSPGANPASPSPDPPTSASVAIESAAAPDSPLGPNGEPAAAVNERGSPSSAAVQTETAAGAAPAEGGPESSAVPADKSNVGDHLVMRGFQRAWRTAQSQIENRQYHDALFTLSIFYNSPDLTEAEHQRLIDVLDPLAARVIYSTEHHLEPPHKTGRSETLMDVAERYDVPWQLLKNINGIRDPLVLVPGSELKVARGPFRAEVDLTREEVTLFLGRLYAGRFPISIGSDPQPAVGDYRVREKRVDRAYYMRDGGTIPPQHADNPYGRAWLDLGNDICIHGSPDSRARAASDLGCISLSPIDADDVYGILSRGSKVTIHR
jgi:hypothetical protein